MWNLYHLKYFSDAARKLSVTESARINRVSVSAVSQAIRALESQVGVVLLEHQKKEFYLTAAGRALLTEATDLLDRVDRLKRKVVQEEGAIGGPLRIACSHSVAQTFIPGLLLELKNTHPAIKPLLSLANARRTRELLLNREVDLALAVHEPALAAFERRLLRKGSFAFAQTKALVGRFSFEDQRFITGDTGEEIDLFRVEFRKKWGREPEICAEVQSWMASLALTRAGVGISLVPDFLLERDRQFVPISSPLRLLPYQLSVYYRKEHSLSPAAESFLDCCLRRAPT